MLCERARVCVLPSRTVRLGRCPSLGRTQRNFQSVVSMASVDQPALPSYNADIAGSAVAQDGNVRCRGPSNEGRQQVLRWITNTHEVMHFVSFMPVNRWIAARSISRPQTSAGSTNQSASITPSHAKSKAKCARPRIAKETLEGSGSPDAFPLSIEDTSVRFLAPSMMLQDTQSRSSRLA